MRFALTRDQRDLQRGMRSLLEGRFGRERLRAAVAAAGSADPQGLDRGLWTDLAAAGLFSLRLPEEAGGAGLGLPEAVLLFEEAGRALVPGPLVATHLAAGAVPDGSVVTVLGEPDGLAAHLAAADYVLTAAGVVPADRDRSLATPVASVDPLTPLHRVGRMGLPEVWRREGTLLTAALQLGSAARTLEMAVSYAREREQFARPIGSFQAVKHLCADMLTRVELARTAVYAAAVTGSAAETAAAKLLADEAAVRGAGDCLQIHGGIGFTWEADVHLHLKRAWLRAGQWQRSDQALEELAAAL